MTAVITEHKPADIIAGVLDATRRPQFPARVYRTTTRDGFQVHAAVIHTEALTAHAVLAALMTLHHPEIIGYRIEETNPDRSHPECMNRSYQYSPQHQTADCHRYRELRETLASQPAPEVFAAVSREAAAALAAGRDYRIAAYTTATELISRIPA